jgi:hypothetical protein
MTNPNAHPSTCTCREHPLPAPMNVRVARDAYLRENGFTTESYDARAAKGSLLGLAFSVPNPPAHRRAIRLHDLHHVATGYGTDHAGEAEISAWQARRGLVPAGLYVTSIVLANAALGLLVAPRRTVAALDAGPGGSLFTLDVAYDALLEKTVGELRALLSIPEAGVVSRPRGLHALAPR